MSNEILDHFEEETDPRKHQKKAKVQIKRIGICFVVLFVTSIFLGDVSRSFSSILELVASIALIVCIISGFIGTYHGNKSYAKKEPASAGRFLTLVANGFFVIIILLLIFINILDFIRVLN